MSVVIRLQNLPLSAKSADIRHFFRGLRIPDGGVHIVGGDKGDAFIAFNSDEDARIAMRKDRGKIKDSKVKLLLSSHMEMQHAIERITKHETSSLFSKHRSYGQSRQSPLRGRDCSRERDKQYNNDNYRSYSPHEDRYIRRSRSPRSRSPYGRPRSPDFRRSPMSRRRSPVSRNASPLENTYDSYTDSNTSENRRSSRNRNDFEKQNRDVKYCEEQRRSRNVKSFPDSPQSQATSDEQRHLEERIAKALNTGFVENAFGISSSVNDKLAMNKQVSQPNVEPYPNYMPPFREEYFNPPIPDHSMVMGNQPPIVMANPNFITGIPLESNTQALPPPPFFPGSNFAADSVAPPAAQKPFIPFTGYYITISGLDPLWTNSDLQAMLKGIFAPQDNIRWEVDDSGFKTGTAFIKLMNKEDFNQILSQATYVFNSKVIVVSECPNSVYEKYFPPPSVPPLPGQAIIQDGELYYRIKGLPFTITHEEIMHFFYGFQIADVYLEALPSGKMTGEGYVCFTNIADYERARLMHGKKLGLAFIEMIPCSRQEMMDAKRRNNGFFKSDYYPPPISSFEKLPGPMRPLCALLTGLPFFIKIPLIWTFFEEQGLKPDAIHLLVNYKRKPIGRGFAEFSNIKDFDAALKCHGMKIGQNVIGVKQVLYDEMTKILSTHKAKHDFANKLSPNLVQISNLPEKAPHVWDPPEQSFHGRSNLKSLQSSASFHREPDVPSSHLGFHQPFEDDNHSMDPHRSIDFPLYRGQSEEIMQSPANRRHHEEKRFHSSAKRDYVQSRSEEKKFPSSLNRDHSEEKRFQSTTYRDHGEEKRFQSTTDRDHSEEKRLQSIGSRDHHKEKRFQSKNSIQSGNDFPARESSSPYFSSNNEDRDDLLRMPVKFEVKIKQSVAKNTKADEAFDRAMKNDATLKLTKLTPEKEIVKIISNKTVKEVRMKDTENRGKHYSKSPSAYGKKINVDKKNFGAKKRDEGRKKNGKYSSNELNSNYSGSPGRYNQRHRSLTPERRGYYERSYKDEDVNDDIFGEVTVEMSNVHPLVGSLELLDFFHGFDVTEDRMIRRYSDMGEPLGDIRVTFLSLQEAKKAVKYLNGQYLNEIPVSLFIV